MDPRRILIIKPSAIGDVVHTLPMLNLLRRHWTDAHIAWLVTPACAGLLHGHPQLNEVIEFDRKRLGAGWKRPGRLVELLDFCTQLRRREFDLVLDFQGLFRSGLLARATDAPVRIGFANAREMATFFYTRLVPIDTPEQHAIDRYRQLLDSIGCETGPVNYVFPTDSADRAHVATQLGSIDKFAVLLPGTNWTTKRWPVEKFAAMVEPLRRQFGLASVLAGGPGDVELARQIPADLDLVDRTNLRQLVALLERASVVIANDSGPMHIAAALGRPMVVPFGPTNPVRTGPYQLPQSVIRLDLPCSPCYSRRCSHQSCMQWIDPKMLVDQIRQMLP